MTCTLDCNAETNQECRHQQAEPEHDCLTAKVVGLHHANQPSYNRSSLNEERASTRTQSCICEDLIGIEINNIDTS